MAHSGTFPEDLVHFGCFFGGGVSGPDLANSGGFWGVSRPDFASIPEDFWGSPAGPRVAHCGYFLGIPGRIGPIFAPFRGSSSMI